MKIIKKDNLTAIKVAKEFAERVHKLAPDAVVKLYGSAARGEMEEFSDIDIYIELPDDIDLNAVEKELGDIAWEIGFEYDQVIQEAIYQKSKIWDSPLRSSPFIKAVLREGVTL